jgi:hypothetical protein
VNAPHPPDPDSTEAFSGSKALIEILPPRSYISFVLSILGLLILFQMANIGIVYVAIELLKSSILFMVGNGICASVLGCVFTHSFHCRRSLLNENSTLIRFINNRFSSGVDDEGTPSTVKCSYWLLIVGYIAATFMTMGLSLAILCLDFTLTGIFGPVPRTVSKVLNCVLYAVGWLLGTSQILNMRTTFMITVVLGLWALAVVANELMFTVYVLLLLSTSLSWMYRNYGYQAEKPFFPTCGTDNAPPIVVCETGTGSLSAIDVLCKEEEAINGTTYVSTCTSSPGSVVPAWRTAFSANMCGDRDYKASEGAYSLLAAGESVHGPGDDLRRQIL